MLIKLLKDTDLDDARRVTGETVDTLDIIANQLIQTGYAVKVDTQQVAPKEARADTPKKAKKK